MELLINVFGQDRPGLVAELTEILFENDANLGDMNMTRLGGHFALILHVTVPDHCQSVVEDTFQRYADGRSLVINSVPSSGFQGDWGSITPDTVITIYGADQPGIVFRVTALLGEHNINICDLESSRSDEEQTYILVLDVARPSTIDTETLQSLFEPLREELDVSIQVNELPDSPL